MDGLLEWISKPYENFRKRQVSRPLFDRREDPEELLVGCLPLLESVVGAAAKRWRLDKADAEDLLSEVQLKLLENDCAALRSCGDAARLGAFLATTVARHWLDRRNHEWGKWRPCAEARRQGPDGELLDRWVNRDGLPLDQVAEKARQHGLPWSREEIERRTALFPARLRRRLESDDVLEARAAAAPSPEQALLAAESAGRRDLALRQIGEETAHWPPEEVLMLRAWMRGHTITAIAQQLRVLRRPLYRQFEGLFQRLRTRLERSGIGSDQAKEILSLERWENELPPESLFLDEHPPDVRL